MNTGNAGGRRIVFVNRFFYPDHSATSQILGDLAFELAHQGWAVEVVTSRMSYDKADAEMPQHEVVKGVRIHRVWSTRFGRAHLLGRALDYITFYLGAAATLWRRVDHDTVVVAKTDPPLISVLAAPIASLRGARLVNWLQDLFPEVASTLGMQLVQGPILKLLRAVRNISLRNATNVVLGDRMHAIVRAQNVSSDRIHIIHNWADGESIRPVPHDSNPLRDEWQLAGRFVIGYSGNLGRAHEFSTILDAAQLLAEQTDLVFLFVGAGAQLRGVEDQVRQRGLTNVRFQAYQRRELLHLSLGVADAHLVSLNPALEGLIVPSKFYGIAAAGRPTLFVGDPEGEIPKILRQHDCGRSVATGDPQALAERILELAGDPALCCRLGANARSAFDGKFDRKFAFAAWTHLLNARLPPP